MGQQCCSEERADNRVYENSKLQKSTNDNFQLQNSNLAIGYQGIEE